MEAEMSIKRLKYIETGDGSFISKQIVKTIDKIELLVGYTPGTPTKGFVKSLDKIINIELEATSPHKIKIKIKNALIKLGVRFDSETRVLNPVNNEKKKEEIRKKLLTKKQ